MGAEPKIQPQALPVTFFGIVPHQQDDAIVIRALIRGTRLGLKNFDISGTDFEPSHWFGLYFIFLRPFSVIFRVFLSLCTEDLQVLDRNFLIIDEVVGGSQDDIVRVARKVNKEPRAIRWSSCIIKKSAI